AAAPLALPDDPQRRAGDGGETTDDEARNVDGTEGLLPIVCTGIVDVATGTVCILARLLRDDGECDPDSHDADAACRQCDARCSLRSSFVAIFANGRCRPNGGRTRWWRFGERLGLDRSLRRTSVCSRLLVDDTLHLADASLDLGPIRSIGRVA